MESTQQAGLDLTEPLFLGNRLYRLKIITVFHSQADMGYGVDDRGSIPGRSKMYVLNSTVARQSLGTLQLIKWVEVKSKAIAVTASGDLWVCEMLTIPHCLENRLTDGDGVVSPTHRQRSTPQKYYFSTSGTHFC
jgi:hypothetical protein